MMNAVYARREVERGSVSAGYLVHSGRITQAILNADEFFGFWGGYNKLAAAIRWDEFYMAPSATTINENGKHWQYAVPRRVVQRSSTLLVLQSPRMSLARDALWHNGLLPLHERRARSLGSVPGCRKFRSSQDHSPSEAAESAEACV
jgi:hypothetical protein